MQTLVLTPQYTALRTVSWQRAVTLVYLAKAEVLEAYDVVLRSPSIEMKMPAVIRMTRGARHQPKTVRFSRTTVLVRDRFACQYCGRIGTRRELTLDHVVPRTQGGKTTWENLTTACSPCNAKKGGRTPHQAGMKLRAVPMRPNAVFTQPIQFDHAVPATWRAWLGSDGSMSAA
jgi:5-methylcytosine-specific restriction endonuclease McrA